MNRSAIATAIGVGLLIGAGCTANPRLKLTEVGLGHVELYLDEPNPSNLTGFVLEVVTVAPGDSAFTARLDLDGTVPARGFFVVFEEAAYSGSPVLQTFRGPGGHQCAGLKVPELFFGPAPVGRSVSIRLSGTTPIPGGIAGLFGRRQAANDVVKIGPRPRPDIGGTFNENTAVSIYQPVPPSTVSRKWDVNGPVDSDSESDWKPAFPTYCSATH